MILSSNVSCDNYIKSTYNSKWHMGRSTIEYQLSLSEWSLKYLMSEMAQAAPNQTGGWPQGTGSILTGHISHQP